MQANSLSSFINSQTKLLKIIKLAIIFLMFFVIPINAQIIPANVISYKNAAAPLNFNCDDKIYFTRGGSQDFIYELDTTTWNYKQMFEVTGTSHSYAMTTIALGPLGRNGRLTLFGWDYNIDSVTTPGNIMHSILWIRNGTIEPNGPLYVISNGRSYSSRGWASGEVYQLTGEIYLMDGITSELDVQQVRIIDPSNPGTLASNAKNFKIDISNLNFAHSYRGSDMAIDAEGNAYVIITESGMRPNTYLVRLDRPKSPDGSFSDNTNEKFKASLVRKLDTPQDLSYGHSIWSFAFLNGKLYIAADRVSVTTYNNYIYEINPLSGSSKNRNKPNGFGATSWITDFATCQVAPIIRGKVYLDADGNGILSTAEKNAPGVENITVDIYDARGIYLGGQETDYNGEYSLMLPGLNTTFYVRLRQPQIDGVNAHQTWASGGIYEWRGTLKAGNNTVEPVCYNGIVQLENTTTTNKPQIGHFINYNSTTCYGAKANRIDKSDNLTVGKAISVVNDANYYSKVFMQTDRAVPHADFALTPGDRSDAPNRTINGKRYNFGETGHFVNTIDGIFLGNTSSQIDADSSSIANTNTSTGDDDSGSGVRDDYSVFVKKADNETEEFKPVQGRLFENGKTYTFRINTPNNKGYLNAWVSFSNNATLTENTFQDTLNGRFITNSAVYSDNAFTDLSYSNENKSWEFNYTVPNTIYTNDNNNTTFAYMRFRYSNIKVNDMHFKDYPKGNSYWNDHPWTTDGEVEDYMVYYHYEYKPQYVPANLTVVNQNFAQVGGDTFNINDHNTIGLFTQIAGKPFVVKMVAHNNGTILSSFEKNVTAVVEFIEYGSSAECDADDIRVLVPEAAKLDLDTTETVKDFTLTLNDVTTNGTFRVTYYYANNTDGLSNGTDVAYSTTRCSDIFSVRPATYGLSGFESNLIGGKVLNGTIKALSFSDAVTTAYNQTSNKISHKNSTLVPSPTCNLSEFNITVADSHLQVNTTKFINGESNITLLYNNIGIVKTSFVDKSWTQVDYPPEIDTYDCIPNNSTNTHVTAGIYKGRVGCDIALDKTLKFIPKGFDNTLRVSDFDASYTYLSNNTSEMHANVDMSISAVLYDDDIATNYHQNCFSEDISYTVQLINENLTDWNNRSHTNGSNATERIFYYSNGATANITHNNVDKDGAVTLLTTQGNFTNGTATPRFSFNFGRSTVERPFIVSYNDFNVTSMVDNDGVVGNGIQAGDGEAHLYFGRVNSKYKVYSVYENATNTTIHYEVNCPNCDRNRYEAAGKLDIEYPDWFINTNHDANDAGNVMAFQKNVTDANATLTKSKESNEAKYSSSDVTNGVEILGVKKNGSTSTPFNVKITMESHEWLKHEPSFDVIFKGGGGDWAGFGRANIDDGTDNKTGRIIREDPGGDINIRMDW
ncbi:MAG: hypothetical protein LBH45_05975 [Campylobacteraceae bacterium]|jgi:hypothetical protein|nr:hypothetical protein [Campylobacteraceae bacterium]